MLAAGELRFAADARRFGFQGELLQSPATRRATSVASQEIAFVFLPTVLVLGVPIDPLEAADDDGPLLDGHIGDRFGSLRNPLVATITWTSLLIFWISMVVGLVYFQKPDHEAPSDAVESESLAMRVSFLWLVGGRSGVRPVSVHRSYHNGGGISTSVKVTVAFGVAIGDSTSR